MRSVLVILASDMLHLLVVLAWILRFVGGGETLPSSVASRFKEAGMFELCLNLQNSKFNGQILRGLKVELY